VKKIFDFNFQQKKPGQKAGHKDGTGLGIPIPMTRKRERAGLRRATAHSLKALQTITKELSKNRFLLR